MAGDFFASLPGRVILAVFYFGAGIMHLLRPASFLLIMPEIVPFPHAVVMITGLCEIAGAIALFVPRLRRLAGAMLALYALCVFPANIRHALLGLDVGGLPSSWWYHAPRFALQPIFIWWALRAGGWCARRQV
ncbi:MAG: DoxX family protein [Beijerinckiaceae bacterium]